MTDISYWWIQKRQEPCNKHAQKRASFEGSRQKAIDEEGEGSQLKILLLCTKHWHKKETTGTEMANKWVCNC